MVQQLLQKTRNKFLQIIPPENLIPNKRLGKKEKRRFNRRVLHNQYYRSLVNLSTSAFLSHLHLPTDISTSAYGTINAQRTMRSRTDTRFYPYLASTSINNATSKENTPNVALDLRLPFSHSSRYVEKMCFPYAPLKNVIQTKQHCDRLNQIVGKNIMDFLATRARLNIRLSKLRMPQVEYKRNAIINEVDISAGKKPHAWAFHYAPQDAFGAMESARPFYDFGVQEGAPTTRAVNSLPQSIANLSVGRMSKTHAFINKVDISERWKACKFPLFFSIQWGTNAHRSEGQSLVDFLRKQLYGNFWNYLFSIHDINNASLKRNRVNDQFKNQYIEYKKLAILYGNLPRRTFAHIMRCATKEGGEIESKFLFILERRLDVVLKRLFFFPTIKSARQWIHQGKILVNNQICIYNSYLLQPADLISIKKQYIITWRKEWFKHFHIIARNRGLSQRFEASYGWGKSQVLSGAPDNGVICPSYEHKVVDKDIKSAPSATKVSYAKQKEEKVASPKVMRDVSLIGRKTDATHSETSKVKRRFLFSPSLMRKWSVWSKLWSSTNCKKTEKTHKWSQKGCMQGNFSHSFFNSSAFNVAKLRVKLPSTVHYTPFYPRDPREDVSLVKRCAFFNRFSTSTVSLLRWLSKKLYNEPRKRKNQHFILSTFRLPSTFHYAQRQFLSALLSLRQQSRVVDGNFQHRLNKIFIKKS